MKVLVYAHTLEIGGSQINAIELAHEVSKRPGFEVAVFAPDGVLADDIRARGLRYVPAPDRRMAPSPSATAALTRLVRRERFDLVHAYEWNTTLDAVFGPALLYGTPLLSTVLSMDVPYLIPDWVPMVVGTRALQRDESRTRPDVTLMEPPIDIDRNAPADAATVARVRGEWGIGPDETLIVAVGRLAARLKLEGLLEAIAAVGALAASRPVRFLIVGDGPMRRTVEDAAARVNRERGRPVVVLAGDQSDPHPFYSAADLCVGMGGSALRALAHAKPLLVQGEGGFWLTLTEESMPVFLDQGWYGVGPGSGGETRCRSALESLLASGQERLAELGQLGRDLVVERFSLAAAAGALVADYRRVVDRRIPAAARAAAAARDATRLAKHAVAVRTVHRPATRTVAIGAVS
ncbi:glycosyltransferase [Leifsonia sp. TF02-11]|uniref:glycosyltransferase n=1 Tax=Leifsonia sp. TF02-11 TaxID=2815212 RepID=UPI001AA12AD6|nr:glycosyltransferase [Leifsonia sp. TF02-11]MBO1739135.1 glycosyltransferase [Leifsonia sp. TF02-11]